MDTDSLGIREAQPKRPDPSKSFPKAGHFFLLEWRGRNPGLFRRPSAELRQQAEARLLTQKMESGLYSRRSPRKTRFWPHGHLTSSSSPRGSKKSRRGNVF